MHLRNSRARFTRLPGIAKAANGRLGAKIARQSVCSCNVFLTETQAKDCAILEEELIPDANQAKGKALSPLPWAGAPARSLERRDVRCTLENHLS